jgi:hypothetical protein
VRNREALGNGERPVGSDKTKDIVSGHWSDGWRRLVMDKRSHWKIGQECELYADQDCLRQMRCECAVCRETG